MTYDQLERAFNEGAMPLSEYRARLTITLNAGTAHDAIERWYVNASGEMHTLIRPLPVTPLPGSWSNIAFNECARLMAEKYGPNWHFSTAAWQKFEPIYIERCKSLEVQWLIEEGADGQT